jgi:hypothetical protein
MRFVNRAVLASVVVLSMAPVHMASARHVDDVTQGSFYHLGESPGNLQGSAKVVRYDDDTTSLQVHVHGLKPGDTYSVHLHAGACDDRGPHYRHDPDGPARPPNELWASSRADDPEAGITADPDGNASGSGKAAWRARAEARSVFIHSHSGGKGHNAIGCADLS